jgi:hypothetical protein
LKIFGDPKILASWKGAILGFKQKENDTLTDPWERFRDLIKSMHALIGLSYSVSYVVWMKRPRPCCVEKEINYLCKPSRFW